MGRLFGCYVRILFTTGVDVIHKGWGKGREGKGRGGEVYYNHIANLWGNTHRTSAGFSKLLSGRGLVTICASFKVMGFAVDVTRGYCMHMWRSKLAPLTNIICGFSKLICISNTWLAMCPGHILRDDTSCFFFMLSPNIPPFTRITLAVITGERNAIPSPLPT